MIKAGLTGNIGSGKTTVAKIFESLGVPVHHADERAKYFLDQPAVVKEIRKTFGDGVIINQTVDRKRLADLVFHDPGALTRLNAIIHPKVRKDLETWIVKKNDHPLVIQEAAILFESGFDAHFDKTIFVSCPQDMAIERVVIRDKVPAEAVRARMANQWPASKKEKLADFVIHNDGSQLVIPQVLDIYRQLTA